MPRLVTHRAAILIPVAAAVALRSYGLGWLPSPAGDEGNWTLYAHQLLQGGAPELAPQAQFVSLLHAHLLAMAMRIFGETFLAARVVGAAAMVATVIVVYWLLARRGSRRAAMAASLLIAVHPWTVMYSRTAAVPYAIALATMTVGPLLWVSGVLERRPTLLAAGVLVISLGAHFSPLTIIGAIACIVFAAARRERRWVFTHWAPYAAVAVSEIHILPLLRSAMGVARAGAPAPFFENFVPNVGSYLHMMATGLGGEATLRHFTNSALAPWTALVVALPVVAIIALAGSSETRRQSLLGGFGLLYLLLGLLLAPVILAPRRYWFMPANHYDRYLFAVLPGFAFCLGEVAAAVRGRVGVIVPVFVAWLALGCDGRIAWSYLRARGVDHGEGIFDGGGGYRGWLVTREPRPTMRQIISTVLARVGPGGATIAYADRVFIPLRFAAVGTRLTVVDVRRTPIPPRADGRFFFLIWPDEVLSLDAPPTAPERYVRANARLRERMARLFPSPRLVETLRQPDGSPLLEIWYADQPRGRLAVRFQ